MHMYISSTSRKNFRELYALFRKRSKAAGATIEMHVFFYFCAQVASSSDRLRYVIDSAVDSFKTDLANNLCIDIKNKFGYMRVVEA